MKRNASMPVGIYEKALPSGLSWEGRLEMAARAGYDYVEISIDESESRLARLDWSAGQRSQLRRAIANTNIPIMSMCLSAHRKYPLGSASQKTRERGLDILVKAIEFASEIGLRIIQVNGYDAFYEPSNEQTQARFLEGLHQGIQWASAKGVMLGLENVDTPFVESVEKALHVVNELNSPWFHLYPDMGNLLAAGYSPPKELRLAKNHLISLHVKDAKHGIVRGVPFEKGDVPFQETFQALAEIGYGGPLTVEMWADLRGDADPLSSVMDAHKFIKSLVDVHLDAHGDRPC
ncbi:MAG: L-ribulose-5-phosphate 3-epimerase [Desulfobacteraceae bacterium]|nr:L-ribulose-5-phosphate 3-epimerase [Desulfobacteraceae bacterium]